MTFHPTRPPTGTRSTAPSSSHRRVRDAVEHVPAGGWPGRAHACLCVGTVCLGLAVSVMADDWPQWMGPRRDGVWRETGIIEKLPASGPPVLWRTPVQSGYSGPAVVGGRLFMLDRTAGQMPERKRGDKSLPQVPGNERVLCLDATSGKTIWEHVYDCPYRIAYPSGPRTTPVVAGGKVYTLGAMGDLL